jgi:hypothetical protein
MRAAKKPKITEHTIFGQNGAVYDCPTVEAIDKYVVELAERIKTCNPVLKKTIRGWQFDIDMLLDLRFLMTAPSEVFRSPQS